MKKVAIIFGSTMGNTESASQIIETAISNKGLATTLMNVAGLAVNELEKDCDLILLGSSTWGDEEIELQEDFAEFYENMDQVNLANRKFAVFGCGDRSYTHFCGAVDAIEQKVEQTGGTLVYESLKIDGEPSDAKEEIIDWAEAVTNNMG